MVRDLLLKDEFVCSLIATTNLSNTKINVFRFKQSQDDPSLLFWRPYAINEKGEWSFIIFFN